MKQKSMGELVMGHIVFSWWSSFYVAFIAVLFWTMTVMFFPLNPIWAIGCPGFMALISTIGALDMFCTNNLKKKSPVGRILHKIGL